MKELSKRIRASLANEARHSLPTERPNPATAELDTLPPAVAFDRINAEDARVASAVAQAKPEILAAVELCSRKLRAGGRLFYVGAGTSGRLGLLDAVECPPTFQSDPEIVQAVVAGGTQALLRAVEGAEDSRAKGAAELEGRGVGPKDVVLGIAAGGTTPFVHGALARAKARGAATIFFACVAKEDVPDEADLSIRVLTGPEVVAGSTRLKAGTATKLVLNTISTLVMVSLGKVHGNLMVDVNAGANEKLVQRGIHLVRTITGLDGERAAGLFEAAEGRVKVACVMHAFQEDARAAEARLERAGGILRRALEG